MLSSNAAMSHYLIEATWDPEAAVWVATSEDVPGLATESASLEALTETLRILVPELLEANDVLPSGGLKKAGISWRF
jgi:hypothetical protein